MADSEGVAVESLGGNQIIRSVPCNWISSRLWKFVVLMQPKNTLLLQKGLLHLISNRPRSYWYRDMVNVWALLGGLGWRGWTLSYMPLGSNVKFAKRRFYLRRFILFDSFSWSISVRNCWFQDSLLFFLFWGFDFLQRFNLLLFLVVSI